MPFAKHKCKEYSIKNILKLIDLISQEINILIFGDKIIQQKLNPLLKENLMYLTLRLALPWMRKWKSFQTLT